MVIATRDRHTRLTDPALGGESVHRSFRLPKSLVDEATEAIGAVSGIYNLSDVLTDALWLWVYEHRRVGGGMVPAGLPLAPREPVSEPLGSTAETADPPPTGDHPFVGAPRPNWSDVDLDALDG